MNPALVGAGIAAGKGVINGDPMDKILKDAVVGGATGYLGGQMMPTDMFGASSALNSTAGNSLNAGASLMGGTGTAVGSNIGAGTTSLLGSPRGNMLPSFDMGMGGEKAFFERFTAPVDKTLMNANTYQPLNGGIAPDMSFKQSYMDLTPEQSLTSFGNTQTPDYVGAINTSDLSKQNLTNNMAGTFSDGMPNKIAQTPDFNNITKSTAEELEEATGGFEKPLYERAFDSVVGFAEKNPIQMASLGLTAFGALKEPAQLPPDSSFARSAGVVKNAYSPTRSPILKVRKA
jgi:hypothetical protein